MRGKIQSISRIRTTQVVKNALLGAFTQKSFPRVLSYDVLSSHLNSSVDRIDEVRPQRVVQQVAVQHVVKASDATRPIMRE